jgi:nucleoside-diphosphate-sugar epimerase
MIMPHEHAADAEPVAAAWIGTVASRVPSYAAALQLDEMGRKAEMTKIALIAGANGIIGKALFEEIAGHDGWQARAISRRRHSSEGAIECDLRDRAAVPNALRDAADTTHLFYAAYAPSGGLAEEDEVNGAMLRNLLDGLAAVGAPLERVVLYQGAKIYGVHIGPVPSPFYEDENPTHLGPNFYQTQQAELIRRAEAGATSWTILRPDVVIGDAAGNAMNIATVIGAYAAIARESGAAFRFPGSEKVYRHVLAQMTDAHALARASLWAAEAEAASGEAFNYVHEPFRWERIWNKVADALALDVGPPLPMKLAEHMPLLAPRWTSARARQGLASVEFGNAVGWGFGDFVFGAEFDVISDMGKIRRAGFTETVDTAEALVAAIRRQQRDHILPA